jgi:hypothetical protein
MDADGWPLGVFSRLQRCDRGRIAGLVHCPGGSPRTIRSRAIRIGDVNRKMMLNVKLYKPVGDTFFYSLRVRVDNVKSRTQPLVN